MIKNLLHSKEKELKKTWPENCPWSKPKYYGIKVSASKHDVV